MLFERSDEQGAFYRHVALGAHFASLYVRDCAAKADALLSEPLHLIFLKQVGPAPDH